MVGRKGFIHIIEAVLISAVAIAMIPSLLYSVQPGEEWTRTNLKETGRDLLASMNRKGQLKQIMSYNRSEIEEIFEGNTSYEGILARRGKFIQYNLRTENAYKNQIRVGFNCTGCDVSEEERKIESILKPVWLNGRFVNFRLIPFSWEKFTGKVKNYDLNVIFLKGQDQVDQASDYWGTAKIENHLSGGRGIVEYVNLTSGEVNGFQEKVFGLTSGSSSSQNLVFRNRDNTSRPNYEPSKLFYGTASSAVTSGGNTKYGNWTLWNTKYGVNITDGNGDNKYMDEKVCISGVSECKGVGSYFNLNGHEFMVEKIKEMKGGMFAGDVLIWFRHNESYEFYNFVEGGNNGNITSYKSYKNVLETQDGNEAGFVVNGSIGRTAWISGGNGDDVKGLVQSAVIWSAGKGWWNFLRSPGTGGVRTSRFAVNNKEIYEPYQVILTLWYIY